MLPVSSIVMASGLYDMQRVYGERIKAYKAERPTVQIQRDSVTISAASIESLTEHRKIKKKKETIAYSNPRVSNSRLNKIGAYEREIAAIYLPPTSEELSR